MRELNDALTVAQQGKSRKPAIKLTLTSGANEEIYQLDRIKSISLKEEPFSINAELDLNNYDKALTEKDYTGYKAVISCGLITKEGVKYSDKPPMWVIPQRFDSSTTRLACQLNMIGIPNLLGEDRASAAYLPNNNDTKKVKDLIREIAGDSGVTHLACYNHTQKYDVVFDSEDALIDVYQPKDGFRIRLNGSRLAALSRLLDFTECVMRFGADGKIHILKPTTTGTTYKYQYSLDSGHAFFSKAYRKRLVIPNYIVVQSKPDDDPQSSGFAEYTPSSDLIEKRQYFETRLVDDDQADDIAAAILGKYVLNAESGAAEVPINCGAEIFDYVIVTDTREGDYIVGSIGSLVTTYRAATKSKQEEYNIRFSFGGWASVRGLMNDLEVYPAGYDPAETAQDTADRKIKTFYQDSAPTATGIGDIWIDTNDNNKRYRWSGSAWVEWPDLSVWRHIETITLSSAASSVTFSGLSTDWNSYRLTVFTKSDTAPRLLYMRFNGDDGANYHFQYLLAALDTVSSGYDIDQNQIYLGPLTSTNFSLLDIHIFNGVATEEKNVLAHNAAWHQNYQAISGVWDNAVDKITSITLLPSSDNFAIGSRFILEGNRQ